MSIIISIKNNFMTKPFHLPFQYFIGREHLTDYEFDFHKIFQSNRILTDDKVKLDRLGMLHKHATFGSLLVYEDKHYAPNDAQALKNKCIQTFLSFMISAWHEKAFNESFNEFLKKVEGLQHFFAWVYLPSEQVIRCFSKNCIFLTNNTTKAFPQNVFFDISVENLNYMAFSYKAFNLDDASNAVDSIEALDIDLPITFVKFTHKPYLNDEEKQKVAGRYRYYELINELEYLEVEKLPKDDFIKNFQKLKIYDTSNDKHLIPFIKSHFKDKYESYNDHLNTYGVSKILWNMLDRIYPKLEKLSEDDYLPKPDLTSEIAAYKNVFKNNEALIATLDKWIATTKTEEDKKKHLTTLKQYTQDYGKLTESIQQAQKTKFTANHLKTWRDLETDIKVNMSFNEIIDVRTKIDDLLQQNKIDHPIWHIENHGFIEEHKSKLIGVLLVFIISLAGFGAYQQGWFEKEIDSTPKPELTLTPYQENNLYGYKIGDSIAIPAQFNNATPFIDNQAKVTRKDSIYVIDPQGQILSFAGLTTVDINEPSPTPIDVEPLKSTPDPAQAEKEEEAQKQKEEQVSIAKQKAERKRQDKDQTEAAARERREMEESNKRAEESKIDWSTYNSKMNAAKSQITNMNSFSGDDKEVFRKDAINKLKDALIAKPNDPEAKRLLNQLQ